MKRPSLIVIAGIAVIVAAIAVSWWNKHTEDAPPPVPTATERPAAPNAAQPTAVPPSFDIVRINPQGEAVIAGRAEPRAEVVILDGGKEIGRVIADDRGEWVFVTDEPLPPGPRELTLKAQNPDGSTGETQAPVVLVVPERSKNGGASLAVRVNPDGSIDILQGPQAQTGAGSVSITGLRYDESGRLSVVGQATPGAQVRVYLDNQPLAATKAGDDGQWRAPPRQAPKQGTHTVRADELDAKGKVVARAEISFTLPEGDKQAAKPVAGGDKITVEPGNSLWRIARRTLGSGVDYVMIFQANREQIRNPDLIYPGQVLVIPKEKN